MNYNGAMNFKWENVLLPFFSGRSPKYAASEIVRAASRLQEMSNNKKNEGKAEQDTQYYTGL